ncbi:MAG: NAD-dependent epimerase/dehydratase family protein [Candidatus Eisenbacteria bacterium]|nr:NAD-dependent epimerase/dehydratase family protein [Candidatus Eisenbacteria bacterium]
MTPPRDDRYREARCLVTGGAGFIGSNLAIALVESGARVTVVDALLPDLGGNRFNLAPVREQVDFHELDLRASDALASRVRGQDYIFNLAGQISHIDSMTRPLDDLAINCDSHLSLLEVCRRENPAARIVYAGTRQQYGRPRYLPVDEAHPLVPTDINGINKMAAETYHLLYHRIHGLRTTSLRLTNTFGPRQLIRHARQGFLAVFIRRALEGQPLKLFGDGSQLRDLNFVDDVVRAFLIAGAQASAIGEAYNLGSREVLSLRQIAETMLRIGGRGRVEVVPFPEDRKRIDIGSCYCSFEKFHAATGWEPRVPVADALEKTIDYYRRHADHYL